MRHSKTEPAHFLVSEATAGRSRRRLLLRAWMRRIPAGCLVSYGANDTEVRPYEGTGSVIGILLFDTQGGERAEVIVQNAQVIGSALVGLNRPAVRALITLGTQVWL